jgi:hypothetical protein
MGLHFFFCRRNQGASFSLTSDESTTGSASGATQGNLKKKKLKSDCICIAIFFVPYVVKSFFWCRVFFCLTLAKEISW